MAPWNCICGFAYYQKAKVLQDSCRVVPGANTLVCSSYTRKSSQSTDCFTVRLYAQGDIALHLITYDASLCAPCVHLQQTAAAATVAVTASRLPNASELVKSSLVYSARGEPLGQGAKGRNQTGDTGSNCYRPPFFNKKSG